MEGRHCAIHPLIALENAKKTCTINPVIEDAIVHPEQILESLTTKSYSYQDATVSNKKILG